jgi:hypothetical protein
MLNLQMNGFLTHTFSECVENHAGMQKTGEKRKFGLSELHLAQCAARCEFAELHKLECQGEEASVLVFRNGVNELLGAGGAEALLAESQAQPFDVKFLNTRRRVIQTKHGRQNNCYADTAQAPVLEEGKGTVIAFSDAPKMAEMRAKLPEILGDEANGLYAETNYYTDIKKSQVGIGFHVSITAILTLAAQRPIHSAPHWLTHVHVRDCFFDRGIRSARSWWGCG